MTEKKPFTQKGNLTYGQIEPDYWKESEQELVVALRKTQRNLRREMMEEKQQKLTQRSILGFGVE